MHSPVYISELSVVRPKYEKMQADAVRWLAEAHVAAERSAGFPSGRTDWSTEQFERLISRFGCSPDKIAKRGHELADFCHQDWQSMQVFDVTKHPSGADIEVRQRAYDHLVRQKCEELFSAQDELSPDLLHVSCTGYLSPSPLQRFVVERGAGLSTRVIHAYHMGCYAALPATRMAAALNLLQTNQHSMNKPATVDVVHTELCTLHFNPLLHSPEQLVVQSLFADGFVRYRVQQQKPTVGSRALKIISMNEEQIPDSAAAMTWLPLPWGMAMTLSRDVPAMISASVKGFIDRLITASGETAGSVLPGLVYAIHPGGPKIIDHLQELLEIPDNSIAASRLVLREYGNMSSATLPHVWNEILTNPSQYALGTKVISLAFGPGLTIAGSLFEIVDGH